MIQVIELGRANRAALATESHSHSVVILACKQKNRRTGTKVGKLLLVDLAGSDRIARVRQGTGGQSDSIAPPGALQAMEPPLALATKQIQKSHRRVKKAKKGEKNKFRRKRQTKAGFTLDYE